MITSARIRAGRGLLLWTQGALATCAAISAVTLNMIESSGRTENQDAGRDPGVLEDEGMRFIEDKVSGFGVVLRPEGLEPHDPAEGSALYPMVRIGVAAEHLSGRNE